MLHTRSEHGKANSGATGRTQAAEQASSGRNWSELVQSKDEADNRIRDLKEKARIE
jgi:hypothetical protein